MNRKKIFAGILSVLLLASCGKTSDSGTDNTGSTTENTTGHQEVSDEYKTVPSSQMEYEDHAQDSDTKANYDEDFWYRNDLSTVNLPDPDVIEADGKYYIFGTTDRTGSKGFDCYETTNFNTYKCHQDIFKKPSGHWATNGAMFAPEIREFDGKYYLYYSDVNPTEDKRRITVLVADDPAGPYSDYVGEDADGNVLDGTKEAIFHCANDDLAYSVLDQTVFEDDDGELYMYWSVYQTGKYQYIQGAKMKDPVTLDMSTLKTLVYPGSPTTEYDGVVNTLTWESYQSFRVAEGPYMIKSPINGNYYLTYSVNHYPDRYYSVCYAYSDDPLGDFKKPYDSETDWELNTKADSDHTWTNLLFGYAGGMNGTKIYDQWNGFMSGTAHHCFFKVGDQYMIGYHAHKNRNNSDSGRAFGMDYLYFDPDTGVPFTKGPSYSIQALPEAISGYKNIAYGATVKSTNVENEEYINDHRVVEHYNLAQEKDLEIKLGNGKSYIEIDFDKEYSIAGLAIYNSAFYDKYQEDLEFVNFLNGNAIVGTYFRTTEYVDEEKEFIRPCSAFTYQFNEIKADKVIISFNGDGTKQINEIEVYGI